MVDIIITVVPDEPFQFADFTHKVAKVEYRLFDTRDGEYWAKVWKESQEAKK